MGKKFYTQRDPKKGNVVICNYNKQRNYTLDFESSDMAGKFIEGLHNAQYDKKIIGEELHNYKVSIFLDPNKKKVCINFDNENCEMEWPIEVLFENAELSEDFFADLKEAVFNNYAPSYIL